VGPARLASDSSPGPRHTLRVTRAHNSPACRRGRGTDCAVLKTQNHSDFDCSLNETSAGPSQASACPGVFPPLPRSQDVEIQASDRLGAKGLANASAQPYDGCKLTLARLARRGRDDNNRIDRQLTKVLILQSSSVLVGIIIQLVGCRTVPAAEHHHGRITMISRAFGGAFFVTLYGIVIGALPIRRWPTILGHA